MYQVIFKEAAARGTVGKYLSLFPGLGFGAGYKILQRVYKFGGQVINWSCLLVLVLLLLLLREVLLLQCACVYCRASCFSGVN